MKKKWRRCWEAAWLEPLLAFLWAFGGVRGGRLDGMEIILGQLHLANLPAHLELLQQPQRLERYWERVLQQQ